MSAKQTLMPSLGWWIDGMFDLFFAIPDGWVINGLLSLPADAHFNNRKIVRNGGHRFSRHFPFPMIVTKSETQKDRDNDIGLLISHGDYVAGFVEWEQYGIASAYSLHWTKIHLHDLFGHGYAGRVEAACHEENNPDRPVIARCVFNLQSWLFDRDSPNPNQRPTLELEFFPPHGNEQLLKPLLHDCARWRWEPEEQPAQVILA